ncbi:MAG: glycosyl transferase family 1 [Rhizobiaceae bacterium]|nr:glycosyl transferase family 1 [Rhizobiaceae bacterium]
MTQVRDALPVVSGELQVLYFVHDLSDSAVRRRVAMFRAGGANVKIAGFRRGAEPAADIDGAPAIDLGHTENAQFMQRIGAVARAGVKIRSALAGISKPDVIVARNLEMLALARRAKSAFGWKATPVVYECLDIHRLVLRKDPVGIALRAAERSFGRGVSLLITSSPAFSANYFQPFRQISAPLQLVENRHLELNEPDDALDSPACAPPWRIGWFGALRCRKSLEILSAFTRSQHGRYHAVLRGRPALNEMPNFEEFVANEPYMTFEGPYRNPEDLGAIYNSVHFSWAIDFFEQGQNSQWLLPNRIYEGSRFGAVPIVMSGTETARFARRRGMGVELAADTVDAVKSALLPIDSESYLDLRGAVLGQAKSFVYGPADCRRLVSRLAGLLQSPESSEVSVVAATP